jgi:hypothetical protein
MANDIPKPHPDDTFALAEPDYRYGVGPIVVRSVAVLTVVAYANEPWWHIDAEVANGTPSCHGGFIRRELYVRQAALPRSRGST